jgi:8-oxo-dGTP pyrophosphatase MutT (NUDIX family)
MFKSPLKVTAHDLDGKLYEVDSTELSFRPALYGVIIQDGKVLLSKQWDGYDFPGGAIELGESLAEALEREVKEETGLEVKVSDVTTPLHAEDSFFKMPYKGNFVHSVHMYYLCEVVGGKLSTEFFDEHEQEYAAMPEWIEIAQLDKIKMCSAVDIKQVQEKLNKSLN